MKKIMFLILASVTVVSAGMSLSCKGGYSGPVESVRIGTTTSEVNSLILVAVDRGYFNRNGLEVDHKIYASGVAALDGMLNHEVDLATGSEFAFAAEVLSGENVRTMGAISRSSIEYLVGRKDRGINSLADLRSKTIGVPLGSRPEFALDRFLYFHGIESSAITLVNVQANKSVDALVNGDVDAVAAWQPYIAKIKDQMADDMVSWDVQEDQPSYTLIMCTEEWTTGNPGVAARFLKSLVQAEDYVTSYPGDVKTFIQEKLSYDDAYMASAWQDYSFSVLLDQALVVAMEDQSRWLISHNLTEEKETPNFIKYIYVDALDEVNPEAVNIIR